VKQAVLLTAFDEAVSRDSTVDSDWLHETDWCKRYPCDTIMIRSYGCCWKKCGWASCTERTAQGKAFELFLTVKMETTHNVGDHLVVNFRRSAISAELWRPEIARPGNFVSNFCVIFGKMIPYSKIFKILFPKVSKATPIDVVVLKFREIYPFWFGELIAERVNTVFLPRRVFPW